MSPAATRSMDESRQAVLRAADELFYAHGITGVVMADVRNPRIAVDPPPGNG